MKFKKSARVQNDFACNLVARGELMAALVGAIKERGWTQAETARFLGVTQPRISNLFQGHMDRFTVDMLMLWLQKLGKDVSISVRNDVFYSTEVVQLALYVCGAADEHVLNNVARLFAGNTDKYVLRVVDVLQRPEEANAQQISSTPCLIKEWPLPKIVLTGDLSLSSIRWQLSVS